MTIAKLIVIATVLSLGAQSPVPQQQNATSAVEGIVVRAGTGEPIADARITLLPTVSSGPVGGAPVPPGAQGN
jgi:hypothetical protein